MRRRSKPLPRALQALSHAKLKHLAKPQVSLRECLQREGGKPCTPERCAGRVRPSAWPHPVARAVAAFGVHCALMCECEHAGQAQQRRRNAREAHPSTAANRKIAACCPAQSPCQAASTGRSAAVFQPAQRGQPRQHQPNHSGQWNRGYGCQQKELAPSTGTAAIAQDLARVIESVSVNQVAPEAGSIKSLRFCMTPSSHK